MKSTLAICLKQTHTQLNKRKRAAPTLSLSLSLPLSLPLFSVTLELLLYFNLVVHLHPLNPHLKVSETELHFSSNCLYVCIFVFSEKAKQTVLTSNIDKLTLSQSVFLTSSLSFSLLLEAIDYISK